MFLCGPFNQRDKLKAEAWRVKLDIVSRHLPLFSRPRLPKWSIILNQDVCSKLSGVSRPSCFFSLKILTSRATMAGLCFVEKILPSRTSSTRWAFRNSFAGLKSLSRIMLKFLFSLLRCLSRQAELLSLNYDCHICRRVNEPQLKIFAKYLRALLL